jgi:hypothetical protein
MATRHQPDTFAEALLEQAMRHWRLLLAVILFAIGLYFFALSANAQPLSPVVNTNAVRYVTRTVRLFGSKTITVTVKVVRPPVPPLNVPVAWELVAGADAIQVGSYTNGGTTNIVSVSGSSTSLIVSNLARGPRKYITARAHNQAGWGDWCQPVCYTRDGWEYTITATGPCRAGNSLSGMEWQTNYSLVVTDSLTSGSMFVEGATITLRKVRVQ